MVGQEEHGNPRVGNLQGTGHHTLARQFALAGTLERRALGGFLEAHPHTIGLLAHDPVPGEERLDCLRGEPVVAGTRAHTQCDGLVGSGEGDRRWLRQAHGSARGNFEDREFVTGAQRVWSDPGQHVRGAASQDLGHVDPTADCQISAQASARGAQGEALAVVQGERSVTRDGASAEGSLDPGRSGRATEGQYVVPAGRDRQSTQQRLDHGGLGRVAHQPVGLLGRRAVRRAGGHHAQVASAGSAAVLGQGLHPGILDHQGVFPLPARRG